MALLSIDEAAEKLSVTRTQIVKWLDAGRIPHVSAGGRRFIEAAKCRKPAPAKRGPKPKAAVKRRKSLPRKG